MQRRKSKRHQRAANYRWRAVKAQQEREDGIPDREPIIDARQPVTLPLSALGYRDIHLEPRLGYVAWRAVAVDTGEVLHCAASKELLRWIAGQVPRLLAARNFG
jgi:hypothetical protein